jgi:hypothetical protein
MFFFKGLHKDQHPSEQPEGTYRDGRNLLIKRDLGAVTNEPGTDQYILFPEGYQPIGRALIPDGRIIVFLADGAGGSEIGVIHPDQVYETLANDDRLDFRLDRPIHATVRREFSVSQFGSQTSEVSVSFSPEMLHISEETLLVVESLSPSPS